jgi:hypothetical protein
MSPEERDDRRALMRGHLDALLAAWMPVATDPAAADALKALPLAVRVVELAADLDGLHAAKAAPRAEGAEEAKWADPHDLAERVAAVSPVITARLQLGLRSGGP